LPYTPGSEGAGIIHALGPGVSDFKLGDKIWQIGSISGTYAQYNICDVKSAKRLPDKVGFEAAAAVSIAFRTAYRALMQVGRAKPNETVFIHGASGGVGIAAIQIAKAAGMSVIGSAGTENGMNLIETQGCRAVNHRQSDRKAYLNQIQKATKGKGADVIVEMLANANLNFDMDVIANKGRIVVVGNRGSIDGVDCRKLMMKEASVTGCMIANSSDKEADEALAAIEAGLKLGIYNPPVGLSFALDKAEEAHVEVLEHKSGSSGKIVLKPWDDDE